MEGGRGGAGGNLSDFGSMDETQSKFLPKDRTDLTMDVKE